ncbi:MAG: TraX family protein [Clostridia bacterium]
MECINKYLRTKSNINKISSNVLKTIAIIAMVIDHLGYYFSFTLNPIVYTTFRVIGRIAMPIFAFLLVQGYIKTHSIRKYLFRLIICAVLSQIVLNSLGIINVNFIEEYRASITTDLNIVFSFCLSLIILIVIDKSNVFISHKNGNTKEALFYIKDIGIRSAIMGICVAIYYFIPIDYGFIVPLMVIGMFFLLKLKDNKNNIKKIMYYIFMIILVGVLCLFEKQFGIFAIFSLIFIFLYNGTLGRKSKYLQKIYYCIFPLQHLILYSLAIFCYTKM